MKEPKQTGEQKANEFYENTTNEELWSKLSREKQNEIVKDYVSDHRGELSDILTFTFVGEAVDSFKSSSLAETIIEDFCEYLDDQQTMFENDDLAEPFEDDE